jgi:hypothetical protein
VTDQTPRIDEATDLKHWSVPSATPQTVTLGPWSDGELHKLFVEVEDSMGWKSLGIVRFTAQAGVNQPPDCSGAHAEASTWPLDGTFAPVSIAGVIDPDGDQVTITVTGVTQDEPVQGPGHGDSCPDAVIESGSASVRLERLGSGNGRVYTVSFTASDGFGGTCTRSVDVCVPHDRRPGGSCIKDASAFNSLGPCSEGDGEPQLVRRR